MNEDEDCSSTAEEMVYEDEGMRGRTVVRKVGRRGNGGQDSTSKVGVQEQEDTECSSEV